jgi:hypothetical protein
MNKSLQILPTPPERSDHTDKVHSKPPLTEFWNKPGRSASPFTQRKKRKNELCYSQVLSEFDFPSQLSPNPLLRCLFRRELLKSLRLAHFNSNSGTLKRSLTTLTTELLVSVHFWSAPLLKITNYSSSHLSLHSFATLG